MTPTWQRCLPRMRHAASEQHRQSAKSGRERFIENAVEARNNHPPPPILMPPGGLGWDPLLASAGFSLDDVGQQLRLDPYEIDHWPGV